MERAAILFRATADSDDPPAAWAPSLLTVAVAAAAAAAAALAAAAAARLDAIDDTAAVALAAVLELAVALDRKLCASLAIGLLTPEVALLMLLPVAVATAVAPALTLEELAELTVASLELTFVADRRGGAPSDVRVPSVLIDDDCVDRRRARGAGGRGGRIAPDAFPVITEELMSASAQPPFCVTGAWGGSKYGTA